MRGLMLRRLAGGAVLALVVLGSPAAPAGVAHAAGRPAPGGLDRRVATPDSGAGRSTRRLQFTLVRGARWDEGCTDTCATLWP